MTTSYTIAIIGATGSVGREILSVLDQRRFPIKRLKLFSTHRSRTRNLVFNHESIPIETLKDDFVLDADIVFSAVDRGTARKIVPVIVERGAIVIDHSGSFCLHPNVPLVIREVNSDDLSKHQGLIANPNCSTIIMLIALKPLYDCSRITRILVSTYQSVSGAGYRAVQELKTQSTAILRGETVEPEIFSYPIAFNLFSHESAIGSNGYCEEEMALAHETRKILHDDEIKIAATTIRVPTFRSHAEAICIEQERRLSVENARKTLGCAPGIKLVDGPDSNHFPMPSEARECDDVLVGRIREDISCRRGLKLFVCGDQLLKGAALNAVQIAERVECS